MRTRVSSLLSFFGVASVEAWRLRSTSRANVAYRHSPSFESDECSLSTWRRLAEACRLKTQTLRSATANLRSGSRYGRCAN